MASPSLTPELLRLSSTPLSPFEYLTDSTNTINIKSDVILIVGKEKFYCHRLLLSLVSPVFTRMFDGEFKEHNAREIILEGKTSESILELLKYILTDGDLQQPQEATNEISRSSTPIEKKRIDRPVRMSDDETSNHMDDLEDAMKEDHHLPLSKIFFL